MNIQAEHVSGGEGDVLGMSYACTQARLHMTNPQAKRHAQAHWLYRLTYNAAIEAETSFSAYRKRQVLSGNAPPKRISFFEHTAELATLRQDDDAGPAFHEASSFPATLLRASVREAHDAVSNSIRKWSEGERAGMPGFRSARDPQTIKIQTFNITRNDQRSSSCKVGEDVYWVDTPRRHRQRPTLTFKVKGLGKLKVRLSRPLPVGHRVVELHLTRSPDGHIEMGVVSRGPAALLLYDPMETGRLLHEAVKHLPADAPNATYVRAAQAAGIIVRGGDVGLLTPLATSDGLLTKPVRRAREEVEATKQWQRIQAKSGKQAKRSKESLRPRRNAERARRKSANRRKTRAYQDAAMLVRGNVPEHEHGHPFLQKASAGHIQHVADAAAPAMVVGMERRNVERGVVERNVTDHEGDIATWRKRMSFAMNRRIAETGMSLRIRRVAALCKASGTLSGEVDPRGTSRECSECTADVPKALGDREHICWQCGFREDRDVNGGMNAVGRHIRQFRDGPDPGSLIASDIEAARKAAEKRQSTLLSRSKGGRTRGKNIRENKGRSGPCSKHQGGPQ